MEHLDTFLARHSPFDALDPGELRELAAGGAGARLRHRRGGAGRGRPADSGAVGDPHRLDGHRARRRADPGARAGRVLRAPVAAHRNGTGVHRPRARAVDVRAVRRRGGSADARNRGGRGLRRELDAKAPHGRGPHRARAARRRYDAGVARDEPGGVLRARRAAARGGGSARAERGLGAAGPDRRRRTGDRDRRRGPGRRSRWTAFRSTRRRDVAARSPVPTVPPTQLAIEATVEMLAAGSEHLVVIDGEEICGVLSATDLLGLDTRSPIALRHMLLGAPDEDTLVRAAGEIPKLFLLLSRAGVLPRDLGRVLSLQHDTVVDRLIDFSIRQRGPAPVPWAWLDLGSAARREFTLASDQDNALAYASVEPGAAAEVDAYFERLGSDVNDGLVRCGIGIDNNGVLARQPPMADVEGRLAADVRRLPARARRIAPDPGHRVVRLPPDGGRARGRLRADGSDPRRASPRAVHAPDGADRDRLPGGARVPRPARHRARRRTRGEARPQARGDHPAGQPGAVPRARGRRRRSRRRSTGSRPSPASASSTARRPTRCARRSWSSTASASSTTRLRCMPAAPPTT